MLHFKTKKFILSAIKRTFSLLFKEFISKSSFLLARTRNSQVFKSLNAHCKKLPLDATLICLEIETKYANWD